MPELTDDATEIDQVTLMWLVDVAEDPDGWFRGAYAPDRSPSVVARMPPGGVTVPGPGGVTVPGPGGVTVPGPGGVTVPGPV